MAREEDDLEAMGGFAEDGGDAGETGGVRPHVIRTEIGMVSTPVAEDLGSHFRNFNISPCFPSLHNDPVSPQPPEK